MRRSLRAAGILVSVVLACLVASAQRTAPRRVFVNVSDAAGAPITGLTAADFDVTDGGTARPVTRASYNTPMRIVLFVDSSGTVSNQVEQFRQALNGFVDALPIEDEIALISFSGQLHLRLQPTSDRQKLKASIATFASDNGPQVMLDALYEADRRFLKNAPTLWPVLVIVTTDMGESRLDLQVEQFNTFVQDYIARGGSAHAVVIKGPKASVVSDLALNLTQNAGGMFESIAIANALPAKMQAIAARIAADRKAMTTRYELEYAADPKVPMKTVEVKVKREGGVIRTSARRPF